MQAEFEGEIRPVIRYRRGVIWCPFCDRSVQAEGIDMWCDGCHAQFVDEASQVEETPVRRRRGRPRQTPAEEVDLEGGDAGL